jgi:hypothetical protein
MAGKTHKGNGLGIQLSWLSQNNEYFTLISHFSAAAADSLTRHSNVLRTPLSVGGVS